MKTGKIKFLKKTEGYGFIIDPTVEKNVFVHVSNIKDYDEQKNYKDVEVEYELTSNEKGFNAVNVRVI